MRNLAKICAVIAICLGAIGGAWAQDRSKPNVPRVNRFKPFAAVSVPRSPMYFGEMAGPGPKKLKAEVTARVTANCPFRLAAAWQGLVEDGGQATIPPKQVKVTINGKEVSIGAEHVQIATGGPTPSNGVDVPIVVEVTVEGSSFYPAGRYGGNLALSIMVGR
jgi:hypothetical protein